MTDSIWLFLSKRVVFKFKQMQVKGGYVYILSNKHRNVLYAGVISDIRNRMYQHRFEKGSYFTQKYNTKDLMFYRFFDSIEEAIRFEKQLKFWKRAWKLELIQKENPEMIDLAADWLDEMY